MSMTPEEAQWFAGTVETIVANVGKAVLGKEHVIRLAVTCLLTEGHLLLEDYPGTGKTSLAKSLAATVQGTHKRIQFTPDLLPGDVTGVTVYDQRSMQFDFHEGPIFASLVLADEINRASPKTQAALLEVMEEGTVTVDGEQHDVGSPFMVIATQNPVEQAGTYRLPEAQLDRFLMKTSLGYPDHQATVTLLADASVRSRAGELSPVVTSEVVAEMAALADGVHVDPALLEYVSSIATESRRVPEFRVGISVRGCLALVRSAKTWAAVHGRHYVLPDDVKALVEPVLVHRVLLDPEAEFAGATAVEVLQRIVADIAPPVQRAA
ncbi:MAG: MoxR family ATPase [Blastococcus sp.]|jgi:MoxR-like ATPase|nr:MoxR family ATPase [Blastococcus sp.]